MRAAVVIALLLLALDPSRAVAHGAGGGDGDVRSFLLLFGGGALVLAGLAMRAREKHLVVSAAPIVAGVGLVLGSFVFTGSDSERPDVHISITAPAEGATVPAGRPVPVVVAVDGPIASGPEDREGGHLHLSVDGKLQQMPYSKSAEVTLTPGRHTVTVEYVDNKHLSYDPPIEHTVEVGAQ